METRRRSTPLVSGIVWKLKFFLFILFTLNLEIQFNQELRYINVNELPHLYINDESIRLFLEVCLQWDFHKLYFLFITFFILDDF